MNADRDLIFITARHQVPVSDLWKTNTKHRRAHAHTHTQTHIHVDKPSKGKMFRENKLQTQRGNWGSDLNSWMWWYFPQRHCNPLEPIPKGGCVHTHTHTHPVVPVAFLPLPWAVSQIPGDVLTGGLSDWRYDCVMTDSGLYQWPTHCQLAVWRLTGRLKPKPASVPAPLSLSLYIFPSSLTLFLFPFNPCFPGRGGSPGLM